jgi:uncharacterized membrane protein YvlD (DUF360 family)
MEVRGGTGSVVLVAALLGILSWLLGKPLFVLIGLGTLGVGFLLPFLTRWLVMALILKLVDALSDRLEIRGLSVALIAALLMSAFGTLGEWALGWIF